MALNMHKKTFGYGFFTGIIACSTRCRYVTYLEADFEVFRPAGATCGTGGGEIWHAGDHFQRQISLPLAHK